MVQNWLAKILMFPFSLLYGLGISLRNICYDVGLVKSTKFNLPVISVGNLSIGGAGKTPHVEMLIRAFQPYLNLATLSRGYKRKSKGFLFIQPTHDALYAGDEPLMYKRKYPDVTVAVSENRALGIPLMVKNYPKLQGIILDDAFQHRSIVPGLNILLTTFAEPYTRDVLLPVGRLREFRSAYQRADVIIVTKCPLDISEAERNALIKELNPLDGQQVFFTAFRYYAPYSFYNAKDRLPLTSDLDIILISAIADTAYLMHHLESQVESVHELNYEDHHIFLERDINYLQQVYSNRGKKKTVILSTEKDAVRLDLLRPIITQYQLPIYILPIEVEFLFSQNAAYTQLVQSFFLNFKV